LSFEMSGFGLHSRDQGIELQFVRACQPKLLNARQERPKRLDEPLIDEAARSPATAARKALWA
jgi:hypothetical protein